MMLATWWAADPLPRIAPLPGFTVTANLDDRALASLNAISAAEVAARRAGGHRPYAGLMDGTAVTYGWVATRTADIGELGIRFRLPSGQRYLWDFATLPAWQGRGLYPRLLRAILSGEPGMERAWIIHAPENLPSGAGMRKAGFSAVGRLSFQADGRAALTIDGPAERARAGAELLGVPLVSGSLTPCWRCRAGGGPDHACACCAPGPTADSCACAVIPRPPASHVPAGRA